MAPISSDKPKVIDKDMNVLILAWGHCSESLPKVDYKQFAELGGYKNAASATTAYSIAKKRFFAAAGTEVPSIPKQAKRGKKRGASPDAAVDCYENEEDEEVELKTRPTRQPHGKKSKVEVSEDSRDQDVAAQSEIKDENKSEDENVAKLLADVEKYVVNSTEHNE